MYDPRTRRFTPRLLGDAGVKFEEIIKMKVSVLIVLVVVAGNGWGKVITNINVTDYRALRE